MSAGEPPGKAGKPISAAATRHVSGEGFPDHGGQALPFTTGELPDAPEELIVEEDGSAAHDIHITLNILHTEGAGVHGRPLPEFPAYLDRLGPIGC